MIVRRQALTPKLCVVAALVVPGAAILLQVTGTSPAGALDVAPTVSTQPLSQSYATGQSLSFTAAASGTPTPTVQWQYSYNGGSTWANLSGATSPTLTVGPLNGFVNGWEVQAVFSNSVSSAASNAATMTRGTAPIVTTQPTKYTFVLDGNDDILFVAAASGTPTPTVQWQASLGDGFAWNNISGATSPDYGYTPIDGFFDNNWEVRAVFTNSIGSAISNAALTGGSPPGPPL